jgi:hypothetical protein
MLRAGEVSQDAALSLSLCVNMALFLDFFCRDLSGYFIDNKRVTSSVVFWHRSRSDCRSYLWLKFSELTLVPLTLAWL